MLTNSRTPALVENVGTVQHKQCVIPCSKVCDAADWIDRTQGNYYIIIIIIIRREMLVQGLHTQVKHDRYLTSLHLWAFLLASRDT